MGFAVARADGERASAPAAASTVAAAEEKPPALRGLDLNLTVWEVSGLDTAPGAYENQLDFIFEPKFNFGRFLHGKWAAPLTLGARLLMETELTGADAQFRGSGFASPTVLKAAPESVAIAQAQSGGAATPYGRTDGSERRLVLTDMFLSLTHDRVATIPKLGVHVELGARVVLPTSLESRIAGLQAAPSLFLGLQRKLWRFNLEYGFRAVKYFYSTSIAPIGHIGGTVAVNGAEVQPYQPGSTGKLNPSYGFVNFFSLGLELPKGFSIEADYFLFNVFTYALNGCTVEGVPSADLCRDGAALGDVRRPGERDSEWFLFEVDWKAVSWFTIGVGLSTYQPLRAPNGSAYNPLVTVSRDNYSTVFLSLSANAEAFVSALMKKKQ